jgi:hypothetical protein
MMASLWHCNAADDGAGQTISALATIATTMHAMARCNNINNDNDRQLREQGGEA